MIRRALAAMLLLVATAPPAAAQLAQVPEPAEAGAPRGYVCPRVPVPPVIDGRLDDTAWSAVPWTRDFVDIARPDRTPRYRTRCRMAWDDSCLYIAAEMEEPRVRASVRERDGVVFKDDDFEVFLDPDGDTHDYYELEINAYGTVWDLFMVRPYRDGGPALSAWDLRGLRSAAGVRGTLNDDSDVDAGWSVELAIPWSGIREHAGTQCPPRPGDRWRVELGRVEWPEGPGGSDRPIDPYTGNPHPEENWAWSPTGILSMHYPERWGAVQFSGSPAGAALEPYQPSPLAAGRQALRTLYYRERNYFHDHGSFTTDPGVLGLSPAGPAGWQWPPEIHVTPHYFEASMVDERGVRIHIARDGRTW